MSARISRYLIGTGSAALAIGLGALPVIAMTPAANAAGGTNAKGSLTVHNIGTPLEDENNEPKVCQFTLVADNYASSITVVNYTIVKQAPSAPVGDEVAAGTINLTNGEGESAVLNLADGHYKPQGQWVDGDSGENGEDNFKAFWVDCPDGGTTGGTTGDPTTGTTGDPTTGTTGDPTTGTTGDPTTGTTGDPTTGTTGGGDTPTTGFTGGGTGAVTAPPGNTPTTPTLGSGNPTTLPRTGQFTGQLAGWALASIMAGLGMIFAGTRAPKHARR